MSDVSLDQTSSFNIFTCSHLLFHVQPLSAFFGFSVTGMISFRATIYIFPLSFCLYPTCERLFTPYLWTSICEYLFIPYMWKSINILHVLTTEWKAVSDMQCFLQFPRHYMSGTIFYLKIMNFHSVPLHETQVYYRLFYSPLSTFIISVDFSFSSSSKMSSFSFFFLNTYILHFSK